MKKRGRFAVHIEQTKWRAPDDVPAAGRFSWIDSGLRPADRDRARRNFLAGSGAAGRGQLGRQPAQIGKARGETNAGHAIARAGMTVDDFVVRQAGVLRDLSQIGSEWVFVTDRNFDDRSRSGRKSLPLRSVLNRIFDSGLERLED